MYLKCKAENNVFYFFFYRRRMPTVSCELQWTNVLLVS